MEQGLLLAGFVPLGTDQANHLKICVAWWDPNNKIDWTIGCGWEMRENKDLLDLLPSAMKDENLERAKAWEGVLE